MTLVKSRNVLILPALPTGAKDDLYLKRDQAIAALAIRRRCSLQDAADYLAGIQEVANQAVDKALTGDGPTVAGPQSRAEIPR